MPSPVSRRQVVVGDGGIVSAQGVAGVDWQQIGNAYNTLLAGPAALLPFFTCAVSLSSVADITTLYSVQPTFIAWPRYTILARIWLYSIVPTGTASITSRFTAPDGSYTDRQWTTLSGTSIGGAGTFAQLGMHIEGPTSVGGSDVGSGASTVQASIGVTGNATLLGLGCYEIPRASLFVGTGGGLNGDGAEEMTFLSTGMPILDDTGESGIGPGIGIHRLDTVRTDFARRCGIWAGYPNKTTTSGTFVDVYQDGPAALTRKHFRTDVTRTLQLGAYAQGSDTTTTGEIKWSFTSGASVTAAINGSTGSAVVVTQAEVDCEDPSSVDGRRSSRDDIASIQIRRTAGAGNIVLYTHTAGEGSSASPTSPTAAAAAAAAAPPKRLPPEYLFGRKKR